MKKNLTFLISLLFSTYTFSQVGVNTSTPMSTLDVSVKMNGSTIDNSQIYGLQAPRLTRTELVTVSGATSKYGQNQKGSIVYITDTTGTDTGGSSAQRINILEIGYYYFDGILWQKMNIEPWNVAVTSGQTNTNKKSMLNTEDIYQMGKVGIGINNPGRNLDVEGTMRLSEKISSNKPNNIVSSDPDLPNRPVYASTQDGQIRYAPQGFTRVVGGYRPGNGVNVRKIAKFNTTGGVYVKVRFVATISASSDINHSNLQAYTSGEFIITGVNLTGTAGGSKLAIYNSKILGYNGKEKTVGNVDPTFSLTENSENQISWSTDNTSGAPGFGITKIKLDQTTGELTMDTSTVISYYFEFLGADGTNL